MGIRAVLVRRIPQLTLTLAASIPHSLPRRLRGGIDTLLLQQLEPRNLPGPLDGFDRHDRVVQIFAGMDVTPVANRSHRRPFRGEGERQRALGLLRGRSLEDIDLLNLGLGTASLLYGK